MASRIALYTPVHKGLRAHLCRMSTKAGSLDYADQAALDAFYHEFEAVGVQMRLHHDWEERALHPLVSIEVPGCVEHLEKEHREAHDRFDRLVTHLDITRKQSEPEKQRARGLEFYLALNRFITFFLHHLDDEEERVQPALWNLSTTGELIDAVRTSFDVPREQAKVNLVMVIAAANVEELVSLFTYMEENVPAPALQGALNLAKRILNQQDWEALQSRLRSV
ncbi:MAG: hemerythrin domain-containing protein [Halobacteriota archaeon]